MPCIITYNGKQYSESEFKKFLLGDGFTNQEIRSALGYSVPTAPFITETPNWVKLGLKVALQESVAQGAEQIAWTTGEQQNERYSLEKSVDKIEVDNKDNGIKYVRIYLKGESYNSFDVDKNGIIVKHAQWNGKRLDDVIGKDMSDKIMSASDTKSTTFEGNDLKVGGTGMKAFYGSPESGDIGIVGRVMESLVGKGSVSTLSFNPDFESWYKKNKSKDDPTWEEYQNLDATAKQEFLDAYNEEMADNGKNRVSVQPSISITPELSGQVESGLPMFMRQPDQTQTPEFKAWFGDSKVVDENGNPLVVYHGSRSKELFNVFNPSKGNPTLNGGMYFSSSEEFARKFAGPNGSVIPVYLKIENPVLDGFDGSGVGSLMSKSENKDGGIFTKRQTDKYGEKGIKEFVVFSPTQIKSATGNQGTFDPANPDIRFMRIGTTEPDFSAVNTRNYNDAKLSWFERKVIEPLQDRMIRSKKLIQSKTAGNVSDKADFYTKENLASGKTLEKARVFQKDLWNPLIKTANEIAKKSGLQSKDISDYLKFKHHAERKAYFIAEYTKDGRKLPKDDKWPTGMTDKEAEEGVNAFESTVDKALVDRLNSQVRAISNFTTMERYKSGMITKETFDDLMTRYKNYVPLTDWSGMEGTNDKVYTLLMSAKGRTSEAADPLPFLFTAAQEAIMRGEKNRIKRSVLEFVKENVSPGDYFIKNAYYVNTKMQDENGNDIWIETMDKPTDAQLKNGDAMRSFNPSVHKHVKQQGEEMGVLDLMVNGKKVFIEFKDVNYKDPKAAKYGIVPTIKNINQDQVPAFFEKLRPYTRWLSSMYTQYSPTFGVVNLVRDVGFGTFNILVDNDTTTVAKTLAKMGKSSSTLASFFKNDDYPKGKDGQLLKEFMEAGALTGYSELKSAAEVFADAKKEIDKADRFNLWTAGGNAALKPIQMFGKGLDIYNRTLENAMRFSFYKTLREQGLSEQKAAAKAKDLTVNFNRKGRSSSVMGIIYIFFNASVQGTERLARSFTDPKTRKKALGYGGSIIAAGLLQSLVLSMIDDEDEDGRSYYEKIPDYVRKNNMIIPNMFSDQKGDFIKIPLPYGINIFYSLGESLGRTITGKSEVGKEALGMLSAMTNVFSPIGGYEFDGEQSGFQQSLMLTSPSIVQPLADLAFNRNFSGRPIYRENFTSTQFQLPDSQMYFEGVNPYIREATDFLNKLAGGNEVTRGPGLMGKIMDINPEWIEYGMEQYLGGPVKFAKNLSTTIAEIAKGENVLQDPYVRRVPFVSSFVQKTGSDFEARASYYENRDNTITAAEAWEKMQESGLTDDADKWYEKNRDLIMLSEEFKEYDRLVKQINQTIGGMKKSDKKGYADDIDKLYEEKTKIMRAFNNRYGEVMYKKRPNPLKELMNR